MTYKILLDQKTAANENLAAINAPYRIAFMSQNNHRRITIEIGTPAQIEKGCATNSLLSYATVNDASNFLTGFNAAIAMQINYGHPVNNN